MTLVRLREARAASALTETRSQVSAGSWPMGYGWSDPAAIPPPGMQQMQRAGVIVTEKTMLQVDVVFTSLRIITTAILRMGNPQAHTLEMSKDNVPYKRYLDDQPKLLTETWGGMYQYDGWRRTIMSVALLGEAFWYTLDYDKLAMPTALEVLHPAFMEIKALKNAQGEETGRIEYWYGTGSKKKKLENDRVTHIPFMAMPQHHRGLSPIDFAGVSGALAMAAYEFGSTWFSQGSSPSFLLTTDRKLGQPEIDRIANKFMVEHSGLANAHLPLVLDNNLQAERVLSSPDEAQYLNTLEYARSVLSSWFGIPPTLMPNALERQSPPSAHTAQEEATRFITYTLGGYTVPLEEAMSRLIPGDDRCAFVEENLLRPDAQYLSQEIMALRNTQVGSINDVRVRKLQWPPLDDPKADDAMAPLASNVPAGGADDGEKGPQPQPKPQPKGGTGG